MRSHRRGRTRRRSTRVKSRSRRNRRSRSRKHSRRVSRRKASSRVGEDKDLHARHGLLKPNPFIKCTFAGNQQELVLKPPSPGSNLPLPPKSDESTLWLSVPFEASSSLTADQNNKPFLKTDEHGAYEVVLPNISIKVLMSEHEDLARRLGMDSSGSLAIAVPTGCVATWDPSYKNDANYESVYTINDPHSGNPDGAWMLYAPLQLPKTPPGSTGPKTIDELPAVQRVTVDGKKMLKFRFQVPIRYPLPESQGGGFIDIQAKLNALEPGQKLRLNMLYPQELPLKQQRTIGVEIGKDQGPGTFVEFQLPESLWDENKRASIVNEQDAEENEGNIDTVLEVAAAVTVTVIFIYNIPNVIRVTKALGSLLYSALDAGFQPARETMWKYDIHVPKVPSVAGVQTEIDNASRNLERLAKRQRLAPREFKPFNVEGLSSMNVGEQIRWFNPNTLIGDTGQTHFGAIFLDIQRWDYRQANGEIERGLTGIKPNTLKLIAQRNPAAFSFIGRNAETRWAWSPDRLKPMLEGVKDDKNLVETLMVSLKAGTGDNKDMEAALEQNYREAIELFPPGERGKFPSFEEIQERAKDAAERLKSGTANLDEVAGWSPEKALKIEGDVAARSGFEGEAERILRLGGEHMISPRRRISPRLARLMKRYKTIQQRL